MSPASHKQQQAAAIKRLEALFKDVNLDDNNSHHHHHNTDHQHQQQNKQRIVRIETKIDRSCEVHGDRYKENCSGHRKNVTSPINGTITNGRRSSLHIPASPIIKEAHPSTFASSLRRDPLGSSLSSINKMKDHHHQQQSSYQTPATVRRDSLGRSMSSLKKESCYGTIGSTSSLSSVNNSSILKRDSKTLAKSMTNLNNNNRSGLSNKRNGTGGSPLPVSLTSTAKIRENLLTSSKSIGNLNNNNKSSVKVGFRNGIGSSVGNVNRQTRMSPSYDTRKFSADSLENLNKRNTWDQARRGSSGSSAGGWDDPIWEEENNTKETCVDEVNIFFF